MHLLEKKYPRFFKDCWECSIEKGWYPIIESVCESLLHLGVPEQFSFNQIKEKFGGLRINSNYYSEDERVWDVISEAEKFSYKICEFCGSKDDVQTGVTENKPYWIKTRCGSCRV